MLYRSLLAGALCLIAATTSAHGTGQHVLGTVTAIDATHLEIKTPKGQTLDVRVDKQTRFREKGNPNSTHMPSVGDRVVIDATKTNQVLTATDVHYSSGAPAPIPTPSAQPQ